jgi:hypothetical protein
MIDQRYLFFDKTVPVHKGIVDCTSVGSFMHDGISASTYVLVFYTQKFLERMNQPIEVGDVVPSVQIKVAHIRERLKSGGHPFFMGGLFDHALKPLVPKDLYDIFHRQIEGIALAKKRGVYN